MNEQEIMDNLSREAISAIAKYLVRCNLDNFKQMYDETEGKAADFIDYGTNEETVKAHLDHLVDVITKRVLEIQTEIAPILFD